MASGGLGNRNEKSQENVRTTEEHNQSLFCSCLVNASPLSCPMCHCWSTMFALLTVPLDFWHDRLLRHVNLYGLGTNNYHFIPLVKMLQCRSLHSVLYNVPDLNGPHLSGHSRHGLSGTHWDLVHLYMEQYYQGSPLRVRFLCAVPLQQSSTKAVWLCHLQQSSFR